METLRGRFEKRGSRPISRVLSGTAIHLGHASPHTSSDLPGSGAGHAWLYASRHKPAPLFGLAPGGVYPATPITRGAVRSYRTISPLPACLLEVRIKTGKQNSGRYIFCGTFRRLASPRRYLAPRPVEPGLSSIPTPNPQQRSARYSDCPVGSRKR
uniref:Uncharacterized protein n=1 Tax=Candidatus Kentrum sp. FW TaxID=2126338 RepID=A0A450S6B9_9GAMM|nr:MAG: hypothetical protein BECKFW1821B_GA0114236_100259 [Candidatus Kentron sp. FW]